MSSNDATTQERLDALFPAPSLPPSPLSPQRLPGTNLESFTALRDALKDNYQHYHVYFNDRRFHNHVIHRALAIYALGGSAAIIRDYYKRDGDVQRPAFESPEPITEANFVDHLGDENFYQAYVIFFSKKVSDQGVVRTFEEFVFSEKYNYPEGRDANAHPEMLARFFSGFLHSLIHIGYGLEFGLRGVVIEGLAMTAIHDVDIKGSHLDLFSTHVVDHITNGFSSLALDAPAANSAPVVSKIGGVHVFDIVARMLKDDRLSGKPSEDYVNHFQKTLTEYFPIVNEHADQWTIDLNLPGEIERKAEELVWLCSSIYGPGGMTSDGHRSDFYLMHIVTSSIFLSSLVVYLSPRSQVLLLRGYLSSALLLWVMRGQPALNIKSFMTTTSIEPPVSTTPAPGIPLTTETTPTPNPFLPILQSALTHPTEHLIKIQRAFAHFDTLYGTRPAGYFRGTELADAELLDGSLFLRAALQTADFTGWAREGKASRQFSFEGFFA